MNASDKSRLGVATVIILLGEALLFAIATATEAHAVFWIGHFVLVGMTLTWVSAASNGG
jgi:hypothetical protein